MKKNKVLRYVLQWLVLATPFFVLGTRIFLFEKPRGPLLIYSLIVTFLYLLVIIGFARKFYREYKENVRKEA